MIDNVEHRVKGDDECCKENHDPPIFEIDFVWIYQKCKQIENQWNQNFHFQKANMGSIWIIDWCSQALEYIFLDSKEAQIIVYLYI